MPDAPAWPWPRSAYIHIPFCAFHCGYCDFAVATGKDELIDRYLLALEMELQSLLQSPQPVETVFIGGGTPTYLSAHQLERLLASLRRWFILQDGHEFSIESNPGTLTIEKIDVLAEHGINRISLGGQSFHTEALRVLERDHQPADVYAAVERLRGRIAVISIDLIFGVPGQVLEDWDEDLMQVLRLQPDHVSTYGLTFEKGTRLWKQMRQGQVQPLEEELELAMYQRAIDRLEEAGFEHYEISNFARPGKQCQHNHVYWANDAYFGFGMGAARYVHGVRELNSRDLTTYINRILSGKPATFQSEQLPPEERARETIGQNLRRSRGIVRERFLQQTGFDIDKLAGKTIAKLVASGQLHDDGKSVRLTREGKYVADWVIGQFWQME